MDEKDCPNSEHSTDLEQLCSKAAGRPRSESARQAILVAADHLLARDGCGGVTMEAIAVTAGVSKATLYRWWPNKSAVLMEAFVAANGACCAGPDTGDVGADLLRRMRGMTAAFAGAMGVTISGMIAEALADPEAAAVFRAQYLAPRWAEAVDALTRAQKRGQIRAGADLEVAVDALYGAVYFRLLTGHGPLIPEFADALVETLLSGLLEK